MKRSIVTMIAGVAALGWISAAVAQGRDAAERGQRLELDELRNDVRQDRLKKPQGSGWLWQPQQNEPSSTTDRKSKRSQQQR